MKHPIRPDLHCIFLKNTPIFEQLRLEEALLRTDERNFCIVNHGSPKAVVMGISGQPDRLLNIPKICSENIPVIQRFSGGGTVMIDENTLFVTFIIGKKSLDLSPFPEPILRWSADLYASAWDIPGFHLKENDYVIGTKKCGGNAQYIRKDRWMHHTSFLWSYTKDNMDCLLMPPKRPAYRANRSHGEFLCRLESFGFDLQTRIDQLRNELVKQFYIHECDINVLENRPHRRATVQIFIPLHPAG